MAPNGLHLVANCALQLLPELELELAMAMEQPNYLLLIIISCSWLRGGGDARCGAVSYSCD